MTHPSDPPTDDCVACSAWRGWRSLSRLLWVAIPLAVTLGVAGLGAAATAIVRDTETRSRVGHLDERRIEASEERRRLAADQAAADHEAAVARREAAEQWRQVSTSLARIEARLDAMEQRRQR